MMEKGDKTEQESQQARINGALGVFMLFFSLVVLLSVFFTRTDIGKLTNAAAGSIIGLIGGAMLYRSRAKKPSD